MSQADGPRRSSIADRRTVLSVLPMQQADKFKKLGIKPPKGALMYGPPGTGKTLLARACAAQTNACYLKLAGPSLVQVSVPSSMRREHIG